MKKEQNSKEIHEAPSIKIIDIEVKQKIKSGTGNEICGGSFVSEGR